jgi:hypothetical protein
MVLPVVLTPGGTCDAELNVFLGMTSSSAEALLAETYVSAAVYCGNCKVVTLFSTKLNKKGTGYAPYHGTRLRAVNVEPGQPFALGGFRVPDFPVTDNPSSSRTKIDIAEYNGEIRIVGGKTGGKAGVAAGVCFGCKKPNQIGTCGHLSPLTHQEATGQATCIFPFQPSPIPLKASFAPVAMPYGEGEEGVVALMEKAWKHAGSLNFRVT